MKATAPSSDPHVYVGNGLTCDQCGQFKTDSIHVQPPQPERDPILDICPTCLTQQAKARKLIKRDGHLFCDTFNGCGGQFTVSYLNHCASATKRIMEALGYAVGDTRIITHGNAAERMEELIVTGHRNVRLPDEETDDDAGR